MTRCKGCRKQIRWAKSAATSAKMPLEVDEENGNILLDVFKRAHVFRDHEAANAAQEDWQRFGPTFFLNHLADKRCPLRASTSPTAPEPSHAEAPAAVEQEAWPF